MFRRSALFFPLVLAILLALLTLWISQTVEQQGPKIDGSNRHDPDYTMNNFVTTQTDATGRLSYVLAATEMQHYPDDDSTVLQRPRFTQYTVDKPYTQIESLRGYISSNGEEVRLVNNVKVVRQAFEDKGEMQVLTEKLLIYPKQDLVKTDAPVRITQAPKTVITGTGMIYDKKAQTVTLLNRVNVHYERPPLVSAKNVKTKTDTKAPANTDSKANKKIKVNPAKASKIDTKKSATAKTAVKKTSANKTNIKKRVADTKAAQSKRKSSN